VEQLKDQAKRLGVEESVFFEINKDINEVHAIFKQAKAAIHTMKFEHFGIAICEMMAAGIITIAHNSGTNIWLHFCSGSEDRHHWGVRPDDRLPGVDGGRLRALRGHGHEQLLKLRVTILYLFF